MKNFYDKLLLAIAALVLIGGVVLYVVKSGKLDAHNSGPNASAVGETYQPISIPEQAATDTTWPEPMPQASGEESLYDVFTPPQIFIDKEGNFTFIPPKPPLPPEPFGIYLAEDLSRLPYRIQIQGFSGDRNKPKECVIFLLDEERKVRFFIRPGEENVEAQVRVLDFEVKTEIDEASNVEVTTVATIKDLRSGEAVELIDGETLYNDEIQVVFRSEEHPDVLIELSVVDLPEGGMSFKTPTADYTLRGINLEDNTVIVEKNATEELEAEILTLTPKLSNAPVIQPLEDSTPTPSAETTEETIDFDSLFQ